jgi:hypothetical protein
VIDSALKVNEGGDESYFPDRQVEAEALMRLSFDSARRRATKDMVLVRQILQEKVRGLRRGERALPVDVTEIYPIRA